MPLLKSKTEKARKKNFLELTTGVVGSARKKAITTLMKRKGWSFERARNYQAGIIASRIKGK